MSLRRSLTLFAMVVGTAAFLQAEQPIGEHTQNIQPTFKEHRIGETAQAFFSIAKMAEKNGMLSSDYCRSYLDDPKVKRAIEKAKKNGGDAPAHDLSRDPLLNVEGCNHIRAALAGEDAEVEARFATEFGTGSVQFIAGHLASVSFVVKAPFSDVVEDMTAKLNASPQLGVDTIQNGVGSIINQRRAMWTLPNFLAKVSEVHSLDGDSTGAEVSLSDPALMKHRTNSLN